MVIKFATNSREIEKGQHQTHFPSNAWNFLLQKTSCAITHNEAQWQVLQAKWEKRKPKKKKERRKERKKGFWFSLTLCFTMLQACRGPGWHLLIHNATLPVNVTTVCITIVCNIATINPSLQGIILLTPWLLHMKD